MTEDTEYSGEDLNLDTKLSDGAQHEEQEAEVPAIPEGMMLIPVELAIALEAYLGQQPVAEVIQGWTGINNAPNEAVIER